MVTGLQTKHWRKDILRLSVLTLITIIVWIAIAVYHSLTKTQIAPDVKKLLLPLTPTLDIDTMEMLRKRQAAPMINWNSLIPVQPEILAVPEIATDSAEPATDSAEIIYE